MSPATLYRLTGILAPQIVVFLWVQFLFFNPHRDPEAPTSMAGFQLALCGLASIFAFLRKPAPMLVVFLLSFIPVGLYLSAAPGIFRWIGILQLVYLGAALGLLWEQRRSGP